MYVQDYDERFYPYSHGCAVPVNTWWYQDIAPYLKNTQMLQCPSQGTVDSSDYACNYNHVNSCNAGAALGAIPFPAETMVFVDGQYSSTNTGGCPIAYCRICHTTAPNGTYDTWGVGIRHNGGANCAFVDGHGKWMVQNFLFDATNDSVHSRFFNHNAF